MKFEKKHGDRERIENVIINNRRQSYQKAIDTDPYDNDSWFEWAKLEQDHYTSTSTASSSSSLTTTTSTATTTTGTPDAVREVYERAVAQVPPTTDQKDHWRRYIYLWIYYAVFEEMFMKDTKRASKVYETCLQIIPHKSFSFAKVWIHAAHLHIRRKDFQSARKVLGRAIGMCGKERIYMEYIHLELALGEIDR